MLQHDNPPDDQSLAEQERAFVAAFETAVRCNINGNDMKMYAEDGTLVATFNRRE